VVDFSVVAATGASEVVVRVTTVSSANALVAVRATASVSVVILFITESFLMWYSVAEEFSALLFFREARRRRGAMYVP
jgi:hypothetical protein